MCRSGIPPPAADVGRPPRLLIICGRPDAATVVKGACACSLSRCLSYCYKVGSSCASFGPPSLAAVGLELPQHLLSFSTVRYVARKRFPFSDIRLLLPRSGVFCLPSFVSRETHSALSFRRALGGGRPILATTPCGCAFSTGKVPFPPPFPKFLVNLGSTGALHVLLMFLRGSATESPVCVLSCGYFACA